MIILLQSCLSVTSRISKQTPNVSLAGDDGRVLETTSKQEEASLHCTIPLFHTTAAGESPPSRGVLLQRVGRNLYALAGVQRMPGQYEMAVYDSEIDAFVSWQPLHNADPGSPYSASISCYSSLFNNHIHLSLVILVNT